jgi:hypothetical protein
VFFFEKKNQKNFPRLCRASASPRAWPKRMKVFFASFSSEKEDPSFL